MTVRVSTMYSRLFAGRGNRLVQHIDIVASRNIAEPVFAKTGQRQPAAFGERAADEHRTVDLLRQFEQPAGMIDGRFGHREIDVSDRLLCVRSFVWTM